MRWAVTFVWFAGVACSAAPPPQAGAPSPASSELAVPAPVSSAVPAASSSVAAPSPAASAAAPEARAGSGPSACPAGMLLIEGDYCTDAEQNCLQWWFDTSNKKKVCEVFEPKTVCVGKKVRKRYCIDTYEWPNKKGERPEVMNRFHQAQVKCAAVGKRMCTESEWTLACEGPEMKPFPYGYVRDPRKCNGEHMWDDPKMKKVAERDSKELARLWRGVRSGSQPMCVSDYGVADMPANTDEVVASESYMLNDFRNKFDSIHTGGPWYKGVRNQCRPKIYTHDEGFYYYFLSFRCCAEPDGKETDPRTPKQQKEKWDFSRVEKLAEFTRDGVRQKLALKEKQGNCDCDKENGKHARVRCHTMCGTLLGSDAVDAKQPPAEGLPPMFAKDKAPPEAVQRAFEAGTRSPPR